MVSYLLGGYMFNYFIDGIRNYINFTGRSNRPQFWYYQLSSFVIAIAIGIICAILGNDGGTISDIYSLFLLLPSLAIGIRRLRDSGLSPWWMLIILVPIIGTVYLIILWCKPSKLIIP